MTLRAALLLRPRLKPCVLPGANGCADFSPAHAPGFSPGPLWLGGFFCSGRALHMLQILAVCAPLA
jgi:hypothetical protein